MTSYAISFEALPSSKLLRIGHPMTTRSKRKYNELRETSHGSKASGARLPFPCDSVRRSAKRRSGQLPRTAENACMQTGASLLGLPLHCLGVSSTRPLTVLNGTAEATDIVIGRQSQTSGEDSQSIDEEGNITPVPAGCHLLSLPTDVLGKMATSFTPKEWAKGPCQACRLLSDLQLPSNMMDLRCILPMEGTPRSLYSRRRQRAPGSGLVAYDQAMSAIVWAAKRSCASLSLGVHIHIGWDSMKTYPAHNERPHYLDDLKLRLVDVLDSSTARSEVENCIKAAEASGDFCQKDGIWLQICRM